MSYAALASAVITQAVKDLSVSKWQAPKVQQDVAIAFLTEENDLLRMYCDLAGLNMKYVMESSLKILAYIQKNGKPKAVGSGKDFNWGDILRENATDHQTVGDLTL